MICIRRDEDGIPEKPCLDCKYMYVEDIWFEEMCDKVKKNPKNGKCSYYEPNEIET